MLRHLDLFSGIGGFALAARMVGGYETVAFCEIEPYCQAVLRKHWLGVPIYDDVRSVRQVECDVITGGFPCQPFSQAGKRMGREDDRHLWPEYRRIISECRPAWVLGENVPGIVSMELDNVLADLEGIGYSAGTFSVPACAVGARHLRERIWIVAHSGSERRQQIAGGAHGNEGTHEGWPALCADKPECSCEGGRARHVAYAQNCGCVRRERGMGDAEEGSVISGGSTANGGREWWLTEPDVGRVAHGVSRRVDRLRGLGNSIVPQVAAIFLQAIKDCESVAA